MPIPPSSPGGSPSTVILSKCGDVVLVPSKGNQAPGKLLVSSAFLRGASSVFDKMLDGRFAEGQALSSANPSEIPLPDDDFGCMLLLCMIIHLQTSDIPRRLDIIPLADFAILCDKYDCVDAVRPWSRVWVLELLPKPDVAGFEKLLMVAYALDLPDEFYKVTQSLIRDRTFSFDTEVASHGTDFLPLVVFARLQKGQKLYQHLAVAALNPDYVNQVLFSGCTHSKEVYCNYLIKLKSAGLWPTKALDLAEYRRRLSRIDSVANGSCNTYYCGCKRGTNIMSVVIEKVDHVLNSVTGMCLDCVYQAAMKGKEGECRLQHSEGAF
ncbi:hypothetical protein BU26DRAFT_562502 [Trematosphaeria pertusa]|uniref:BTB domain-containing protein n=1 Tax=Trematosphaeria pertusa TaxID=390896 RepID=A0A6A6IJH1_9PLEO|nr:uncharacterized protein BU26DRAFT_562502 [Trematosphaeria pertusa]KAF2250526.1 hypothetical protein BU26DRAFT_562502 [Trematosphaeria pertusa]